MKKLIIIGAGIFGSNITLKNYSIETLSDSDEAYLGLGKSDVLKIVSGTTTYIVSASSCVEVISA